MDTDKLVFISISLVTIVVLGVIVGTSFKKADTINNNGINNNVNLLENARNVKGSDSPLLTIVEFSDYECPYCKSVVSSVKHVLTKYPEEVKFVYRHFPLSFHKGSYSASLASEAAAKQGSFWDYYDVLFDNQHEFTDGDLVSYAEELGLDVSKFNKDRATAEVSDIVKFDIELGRKMNINGTPSFFFLYNDTVVSVEPRNEQDFISKVDALVEQLKGSSTVDVVEGTNSENIDN